jgi:hypothetical protein
MVDFLTTSENMFEFNHKMVDFQAREVRLPKGNMTRKWDEIRTKPA